MLPSVLKGTITISFQGVIAFTNFSKLSELAALANEPLSMEGGVASVALVDFL